MMPKFLQWRRYLWAYRSAAGGWYVSVLGHGFHIVPADMPQVETEWVR